MNRFMLGPWPYILLAAVEAGLAGVQIAYGGWLDGAADLIIAGTLLTFAALRLHMLRVGIRIGYEAGRAHGYLQARAAMYESLREAQLRGMGPADWVQAELERDTGGP